MVKFPAQATCDFPTLLIEAIEQTLAAFLDHTAIVAMGAALHVLDSSCLDVLFHPDSLPQLEGGIVKKGAHFAATRMSLYRDQLCVTVGWTRKQRGGTNLTSAQRHEGSPRSIA
jgi:hypothetical protein